MEKKYVFIGGKQIGYECLKVLLNNGVVPSLVITNPDDNGDITWHDSVADLAKKNNLQFTNAKKLKSKKLKTKLTQINPEIIFCIGSTVFIPKSILKSAKIGTVNIHPALLPKYRGRYSTVHAIFNGEKITGVTLHWMNEKIDAGPIILQESFPILPEDTGKSVYDKFTKIGVRLFSKFLKNYLTNSIIPAKDQNEKLATYYPKGLPNGGNIDWDWSGKKIYNFIRAMTFEPFPPVTFKIGKKTMIIADKKYIKEL